MLLGTGILLLPMFHPVHVAEEFATLDHLSGGRVILGVGAGYRDNEFAAFGVDPETRFRRLDESLRLIRALWTGEPVTHDGEFYPQTDATIGIRPLTPGGPPIWIGAGGKKAVRRAARLGDAWYAPGNSPSRRFLPEHLAVYNDALAEYGRDPATVHAARRRGAVLRAEHRTGRRGGAAARPGRVLDLRRVSGAALAAGPLRRTGPQHAAARLARVPRRTDQRPAGPGLRPPHLPSRVARHADRASSAPRCDCSPPKCSPPSVPPDLRNPP